MVFDPNLVLAPVPIVNERGSTISIDFVCLLSP